MKGVFVVPSKPVEMPPMIGPVRGEKEEGVDGVIITVAADVEETVIGGGGGGPWGLGGGA